eukprot:CAMPEP_0115032494 /NCGR_PEP_ID=MMETSP0216-20121206/39196_1 /TAXON_ID=223996 /ORGANISM="Protocruzia adherens, Strain Boccale" /LENGTH=357 /DNA_ID=CAMNT_0002410413 /DNA_START=41 /DNA_END=1114 /DNA_ORIENTATION=+
MADPKGNYREDSLDSSRSDPNHHVEMGDITTTTTTHKHTTTTSDSKPIQPINTTDQLERDHDQRMENFKSQSHLHALSESDRQMIQNNYEGLDFEPIENQLFIHTKLKRTSAEIKWLNLQAWLLYAALGILVGIVSSLLVILVAPEAGGSGIAQVKAYLNGVDQQGLFDLKVLVCKAAGIVLAISGGMPCGDEGPMVHNGAVVGANIDAVRCGRKRGVVDDLRNDAERREFITAGTAVGISAAFGSPVGGLLFSFEEASSFWTVPLMLKVFLSSTLATLVLNIFRFYVEGPGYFGGEDFAIFLEFDNTSEDKYTLEEMPVFILMGVAGGLLGALFNSVNHYVNIFRKKVIGSLGKTM